jgi:hypothetical protein
MYKFPAVTSFGILLLLAFYPVTASLAQTYPEVHEEPYHVPVLRWGPLRYLRVQANPGDTTAFHLHQLPILYMNVHEARVALQQPDEPWRHATLPAHWIGSDGWHDTLSLVHRFAVVGKKAMNLVAVELLRPTVIGDAHPCPLPLRPMYERHGFAVYSAVGVAAFAKCGYPVLVVADPGGSHPPGTMLLPDVVEIMDPEAHKNLLLWMVVPTITDR